MTTTPTTAGELKPAGGRRHASWLTFIRTSDSIIG